MENSRERIASNNISIINPGFRWLFIEDFVNNLKLNILRSKVNERENVCVETLVNLKGPNLLGRLVDVVSIGVLR